MEPREPTPIPDSEGGPEGEDPAWNQTGRMPTQTTNAAPRTTSPAAGKAGSKRTCPRPMATRLTQEMPVLRTLPRTRD